MLVFGRKLPGFEQKVLWGIYPTGNALSALSFLLKRCYNPFSVIKELDRHMPFVGGDIGEDVSWAFIFKIITGRAGTLP